MATGIFISTIQLLLMKKLLIISCAVLTLASCGSKPTKVIVMASGKITAEGNTVNFEPGTTHNEVVVQDPGESIVVKTEGSDKSFPIAGPGTYILNLKKDTIAGSYQQVGKDVSSEVISQEALAQKVDSLYRLMAGTNVSAAARNYNIKPGELVKITDNGNAQVVGPFMRMPASFEGGKELEIYKFYTNKELRETAEKLTKMITPAEPVEE